MGVINYFIILSTLGIPIYGIREMAKTKGNRLKEFTSFSQLFAVNILLVLLSYSVLVLFIFTGIIESEVNLILINSLLIVFSLFEAEWYFQGIEDYKFITLRNLVVKIIALALVFIFVQSKSDYNAYAFIMVFALGGNAIVNAWFFVHRFGKKLLERFSFRAFQLAVKEHLSLVITSSLLAVMGSIYLNLDTVMIGYFSSKAEVGIYTAPMRIVRLAITIILALNTVMIPKATQFFEKGETVKWKEIINITLRYIFFVSLPAILLLYYYAEDLILLYAGESFRGSIPVLQILVLLIFTVSLSNLCGMQILFPGKKEKKFLIAVTLGAGLNFTLNLILIPNYQAVGASVASLITEFLIAVVLLYFTKNYFSLSSLLQLKNYFIALLLMGTSLYLGQQFFPCNNLVCRIIALVVASLIYLVTLWLLKDELLLRKKKHAKTQ